MPQLDCTSKTDSWSSMILSESNTRKDTVKNKGKRKTLMYICILISLFLSTLTHTHFNKVNYYESTVFYEHLHCLDFDIVQPSANVGLKNKFLTKFFLFFKKSFVNE